MSKNDELRALREARYEAARTRAAKPAAASSRTAPSKPRQAAVSATKAETVPEPSQDGLCGHRAISGRTCTREKGHAAKSHRYS